MKKSCCNATGFFLFKKGWAKEIVIILLTLKWWQEHFLNPHCWSIKIDRNCNFYRDLIYLLIRLIMIYCKV
jgi:hypothetical protein